MVNESELTGAGSADKIEGVKAALAPELEQINTYFPKGNLAIADRCLRTFLKAIVDTGGCDLSIKFGDAAINQTTCKGNLFKSLGVISLSSLGTRTLL